MKTVICTLGENDFQYGLGTLINSIALHGFSGEIIVGWRQGEIPWLKQLSRIDGDQFSVNSEIDLRVIPVDPKMHLTNFKPLWMKTVMEKITPSADACFYFDPDVIITHPWWFFHEWVQAGIAVCEDRNSPMPNTHPRRQAWRTIYRKHGIELRSQWEQYANGGCVGISKEQYRFLDEWEKALKIAGEQTGAMDKIVAQAESWFPFMDQDALNAALMFTDQPVSWVGHDGMNFDGRGIMMHHDLGPRKPWRRSLWWRIAGRVGLLQHPCFRYSVAPIKVDRYF